MRSRVILAILLLVYLGLLLAKKSAIYLGFISDYAADLLAMPVVLGLVAEVSYLIKGTRRISIKQVAIAVTMFAFIFEWWAPRVDARFTADWVDVFAYGLGAAVYYFLIQNSSRKEQKMPPQELGSS